MMDSVATSKQPAPTGHGEIILDKILQRIDRCIVLADPKHRQCGQLAGGLTPQGLRRLAVALTERAAAGEKKYGTLLRANNGRDATIDLYQELLDALMYTEQAEAEAQYGGHLVPLLLSITCQVAQAIALGEKIGDE